MSQSKELDDELLPEFDFAPGAVRPTELDLDAIFDLELERIRWEEENGIAEPVESAPPESASSIEEIYMEDVVQRLKELYSEPQLGENESDRPEFDEERYHKAKPLFEAIFADILKKSS